MAKPTNIDMFDRCVGVVLASLYESFPCRINMNFSDVPEKLFDDADSIFQIKNKFYIHAETVRWLRDAEYLWASSLDQDGATGLVLSPKGLQILKTKPRSLFPSYSIGQTLVQSVKEGAKESLKKTVAFILSKGAEYAISKI